jgi:hypothetical protein
MLKTIGFFTIPLEYDYSTILKLKESSPLLQSAIEAYMKEMIPPTTEIFKVEDNIIVAEDGYRVAYFLDEYTE